MVEEPFSQFASYYDRFMVKYVDYKSWVEYFERIFKRFGLHPKTILDLACGTGIPTMLLARCGHEVVALDRSPEMLQILDSKKQGLPIKTIRADIRDFSLPSQVDAAVCLYDSLNYLLVEEDLVCCFSCVRRALVEGGLFAFDMNTVYGLAEFWGTRTTMREAGGVQSVWQNSYDTESRVSTLHLTFWEITKVGPPGTKFEEIHQERAYYPEEVERCLRQAGFREVYIYQHGAFIAPGPCTTRMMVVAR